MVKIKSKKPVEKIKKGPWKKRKCFGILWSESKEKIDIWTYQEIPDMPLGENLLEIEIKYRVIKR